MGWLGTSAKDPRLVIVLPAQASEAWLVAAHAGATPQLERTRHPEETLAKLSLVSRHPDGTPAKNRRRYEQLALRLRDELERVRASLAELERFASKLEAQASRLA